MQTRCSLGAGRFGSAEAGKGSRGSRAPRRSRGGGGGPECLGGASAPRPGLCASQGRGRGGARTPGRRETAGRGGTRRFVPGPRPPRSRERPPLGAPALGGVRDARGGVGSQTTPWWAGRCGDHALGMADGFTKQSQNFKTAFQTITDLMKCAPVHPHCPGPLFSPADRCWYLINISVFFLLWILVFFALLGRGYKRQGLHLISL
ncbi:unnamed protein product [Nyctereutes procyonoides]|uniref:(raccoon dog) hypothetical protein n=1 Tax=Nyctereutes procyonoides TaxID=34880 RepID=A0A811Z349_NYCPR|nr:unnamed protein product [Nyctereutes procyonoides]